MKKITLGLLSLSLAFGLHAQFVDFDPTLDPQKGEVVAGDINNDGFLDVIFSGINVVDGLYHVKDAILINNGDGTFTKQTETNVITPGHLACIKFADIDGDGDLDAIFCGTGGEGISKPCGIALNDGTGVFTLADSEKYPVETNLAITCGFADFDNNGLMDYYFFGNGLNNCAIYFQLTPGNFTKSTESFGAYNITDPEVTVIDFNNDGYLDIFINGWLENSSNFPGEVSGRFCATFANDMFGGFRRYAQPNIIQKSFGTASWGDIDGDGWMDLVLQGDGWVNSGEDSDGIVRVYKNTNGTLEAKATFSFFRQINVGGGNILADWDNDGDLDIIVGGWSDTKGRQATSLYTCTDPANFTFTESPLSNTYFPGLSEHSYSLGDLNNDGKADLLMMGFNGDQATQIGKFQRNICGYIPNTSAAATSKPEMPTGLSSSIEEDGDEIMLTLTWAAPASEAGKKGTTYNLAIKNTSSGKWYYNPMAIIGGEKDGFRQAIGQGNVLTNKSIELYNLPEGHYEWTVQAINGAFFGGTFAEKQTFTIGDPSPVDYMGIVKPTIYVSNKELIVNNNEDTPIRIFNVNGQIVFSQQTSDNLNIPLNQGIYIVEIANKATYRTKIIIN